MPKISVRYNEHQCPSHDLAEKTCTLRTGRDHEDHTGLGLYGTRLLHLDMKGKIYSTTLCYCNITEFSITRLFI